MADPAERDADQQPACFSSSNAELPQGPKNAAVVASRLQANAQPPLAQPGKGSTIAKQDSMVVLQSFPSGTKERSPEISRKLAAEGIGVSSGTRANSRCIHAPSVAVQR